MHAQRLIAKKRDGQELSAAEIQAVIQAYSAGEFTDYQMAALAMAIYLRGMTIEETAALTQAMLDSGSVMQWPGNSPVVDKHSTGGVGDKTSLILAPLLACCGVRVPMISGRGLGATGGTLDKLEAIPGFRTDFTVDEIYRQVEQIGCIICGANEQIAPADRKLYALRDVTATVASIPLITASIMSKKLAENPNALVLDVKFGNGAFMKTLPHAEALAESLVSTGQRMGINTTALLSDMNQPLGQMIGNSVEVQESRAVLAANGPADVTDLTIALATELLASTNPGTARETLAEQLRRLLDDGTALAKFEEMVVAQGGETDHELSVAPAAEVASQSSGYVASIDCQALGELIVELGGGRKVKEDVIDPSVGLKFVANIGTQVTAGETLAWVFAPKQMQSTAIESVQRAVQISSSPPSPRELIVSKS